MTPRRCTTRTGSVIHATTQVTAAKTGDWWVGYTLCGHDVAAIVTTLPFTPAQPMFIGDNTDPVTCTRCLAALTRLGDAIDACIAGRSG